MPVKPDLAALLTDYKGDASMAEGEVFDSTPANLEQRVERYTLANGMKVALLNKQTRGNTVQMALRIGYGDEKTLAGKSAIDELASALMMRGARGLSRQAIRDRMDALRASGGMGMGGGSFQTKRQYVSEVLQLVAQVYDSASFPPDELEVVRKEFITMLEESANDPDSLANVAMERHFSHYPQGDWRYVPTIKEHIAMIKAVTREQIVRHVGSMRGLNHAEIAIVGDFDVATIKAALNKLFATSKRATPYVRVNREYKPVAVKHERINTPDKENASYMTRVTFPLTDNSNDYAALTLADFIVGGSAGARLFQRVREKEGLSYDVYSSLSVPTFANNATWTFGFIANPQNSAKAEASLKDELQKLLGGALTDDEFTAQRQSLLDQRMVRRSQDSMIALQLVTQADTNRTYKTVDATEAKIRSLTKADFDAVLKKYINLAETSSFVAGDFSKVK